MTNARNTTVPFADMRITVKDSTNAITEEHYSTGRAIYENVKTAETREYAFPNADMWITMTMMMTNTVKTASRM